MQAEVRAEGKGAGPLLQVESFWTMKNGYCMPCSIDALRAACYLLDPLQSGGMERRRRFMDSITFGTHWDTQVGDGVRPGQSLEECRKVTACAVSRCLMWLGRLKLFCRLRKYFAARCLSPTTSSRRTSGQTSPLQCCKCVTCDV